jgi:hypothetical protein
VDGALPVLFFGDLFQARVATIGINPSKREYLDTEGYELTGSERRFETLTSLGARDRASLTDEQCERAVDTMRNYFQPAKPVYRWFRSLDRVMQAMGYSYRRREVCHLDLVQEATDPTWSGLPWEEQSALASADRALLRWEIENSSLQAVICNGRSVLDAVCDLLGATSVRTGTLARITWRVGTAEAKGRLIGVAGWNIPLARPTGLGIAGEDDLGRCLATHLADVVPGYGAPAGNPISESACAAARVLRDGGAR